MRYFANCTRAPSLLFLPPRASIGTLSMERGICFAAAFSADHLPYAAFVRRADDDLADLYEYQFHRGRHLCRARGRDGRALGDQYRPAVAPPDDRLRDDVRHGRQRSCRGAARRGRAASRAAELLSARRGRRAPQHGICRPRARLLAPSALCARCGRRALSALRNVRRPALHLDAAHDGGARPRHLPHCGGTSAACDALFLRRGTDEYLP